MEQATTTSTICRVCLRSCGIRVRQSEKGLRIKGNPEHLLSRGFVCFRGAHYDRIWESKERIREPLLKKDGKWVPIPYEEAVALLAKQMNRAKEQYGAQSVAFLKGESLKHQEISGYIKHLAHAFGTPNYLSIGSMCQRALVMGHDLTYGGVPKIDFERIRVAVLWGRNLAVSAVHLFSKMRPALKKGLKLVVIDPSETKTTRSADIHLHITPGSDGFLALAFMKTAVETYGLSADPDREIGWEGLETHLRELSIDFLLKKTGITEKDFLRAAEMMFTNLPGWNQAGLGLELQPNGIQAIRAVACLQSLMDPGYFPVDMEFPMNPLPGMDAYPDMPDPIGKEQAPLFVDYGGEGQAMHLPEAVLRDNPYPVRMLLVAGANPALTFPASGIQREMFDRLDFLAVCDLFMTQTAQQADLVLPGADFLDSMEIHDYGRVGKPYLGLIRPIEHSGPGWPIWKWVFRLANELGLHSFFPWKDNEEALRYKLSGTGISFDQLKESQAGLVPYPEKVLFGKQTDRTKKVRYHSDAVAEVTHTGALTADSFHLPFTTDSEYPFWLSTGDRVAAYQHSQFRISSAYLKKEPEPIVEIHPDAARSLGIDNEDVAVLSTRYGEVAVKARVTKKVRKDCLIMLHGWEEANVNELTGLEYFDPVSGFPWCRALPAKITANE